MATATYVYCLAQSARKPASAGVPAGLPGASTPAVAEVGNRIWLVYADVPLDQYGESTLAAAIKDLEWVSRVAVAHESVVEHFAGLRGTTIIPMKLFTMFSGLPRAVSDVRKRRHELGDVFARLGGCEEWGVRVLRNGVNEVDRSRRAATRPATGSAFLTARKQARDDAREALIAAATAAEHAYSSLAQISREHRRRSGESPGVVAPLLDAAFLVPVRSRARFESAAEKAARTIAAAGAALTLTGPWPPYNFVAPPRSQEIS